MTAARRRPAAALARWLLSMSLAVAGGWLVIQAAHAGEPPPGGDNPDWEAKCQAGGQAWRVRFTSASGDVLNDDMGVALHHPSGEKVLPLPLPPAFYESAAPLRRADSVCDKLGGRLLGPRRLALLLSRNGRPSWNMVDLVLVDLDTFRVVDRRIGVAEIKTDKLVLSPVAGSTAFDVRLVRGLVDKPECDCADAFIEGWMRISLDGQGRLRTRWVAR